VIVVVPRVVFAVGLHHGLDLGRIVGEGVEHLVERDSEPLQEDAVRGNRAPVGHQGMAVGEDDQVDGVDERAVKIEQEGGGFGYGFGHRSRHGRR